MDPFDLGRVPARGDHRCLGPQLDRALAGAALVRAARPRCLPPPRPQRRADRARDRTPPILFPLATNPSRFRPSTPTPAAPPTTSSPATTGARSARSRRHCAPAPGERLDVYGKGWEARPGGAPRPRPGALRGAAGDLCRGQAGPRRHLRRPPSPTAPSTAGVRRAGLRHARDHQLRGGRSRAVRRGLPGLELAREPARAARRAARRRAATDGAGAALPGEVAAPSHLPAAGAAPGRGAARARGQPFLLPQDRRPELGGGGALGRPALRPGAGARAAPARAPLPDPGAGRVGGRRGARMRRGSRPPRPQPPPPQAGAAERALGDQPPRRPERRGVRRLRPRLRRLGAVREPRARARPDARPRPRAGDRPALSSSPTLALARARPRLRRQLARRAAPDRRRPAAHRSRPRHLRRQLGGPDRHPATSSPSTSPTRSCARSTRRPRSSSATTGRTCASTASSPTASTTPWPAARWCSATCRGRGGALRRRGRDLRNARPTAPADRAVSRRSPGASEAGCGGPGPCSRPAHVRAPRRQPAACVVGANRIDEHPLRICA